jgi:ABC-type spermidine/putrescine transport system permease subunit I
LIVGLGAFPASLLFGLVWQQFGSAAAFDMGAALALVASVMLSGLAVKKPVEVK